MIICSFPQVRETINVTIGLVIVKMTLETNYLWNCFHLFYLCMGTGDLITVTEQARQFCMGGLSKYLQSSFSSRDPLDVIDRAQMNSLKDM